MGVPVYSFPQTYIVSARIISHKDDRSLHMGNTLAGFINIPAMSLYLALALILAPSRSLFRSLSHTHSITVFPSLCHSLSLFAVIKGATPSRSERHIHTNGLPVSLPSLSFCFTLSASICVRACVCVCVCVRAYVCVIVF